MIDLPRVIGHRGAAALAPENTLGGFARAAELGCTWVEFDVHLTRDDVPVVVHDRNMQRTTGRDQMIDDAHSLQLPDLDAGSWFDPYWADERIPTLAQALDACLVLGLRPNIEIRASSGHRRAMASAVGHMIRERWPAERPLPLVSSFSVRALYHLRTVAAEIPLGLLMWQKPRRFWRLHAKVLGCASIHVDNTLATPALIARVHARGRKVAVYVVNDPEEAQRLFDLGVDTVFTDALDRVCFGLEPPASTLG